MHGGNSAEKPVAVVAYLLKAVTCPGDLVVDPACGSGASLEAAARLGCRVIGADIDEKQIILSAERLRRLGIPVEIKTLEEIA